MSVGLISEYCFFGSSLILIVGKQVSSFPINLI
nr:MAG TPA: hypothetical protein [Caudoviricetes sp.]